MAHDPSQLVKAAEAGLATQEAELAASRTRQVLSIMTKTATGNADIVRSFSLDRTFRLIFVRCHFAGTAGSNPLSITLDSANGTAHDAQLYTLVRAGIGHDVNFRIPVEENREPSPWTFGENDAIRIDWTNPDGGSITWGLEVGLALAS